MTDNLFIGNIKTLPSAYFSVISVSCKYFIHAGSDVVDWLHRNVEGFTDRREARKYAGNLLKAGYIRHTVSKVTFSEQCYYVFGDLCGGEDSRIYTCHILINLAAAPAPATRGIQGLN